ncbi:MAG: hypothetical protein WA160_01920 [Pseudobdellovibrio sp.]
MKNLAFKKETINYEKRSLALVDVLDSADINTDKAWFKNFVKSIFETNDLNLETFDRIEMKKTIQSENDYFN